jgi:hypothetical protein
MNGGMFAVNNTVGTPLAAVSTIALTNVALHLQVSSSPIFTNVVATNFTAAGANIIAIDSAPNLAGQVTFPLISYASLTGTVPGNLVLGSLPKGLSGTLVNNAAQKRVDLRLEPAVCLTMIPYSAYMILAWPTNSGTFTLQSATNLVAPVIWSNVSPGSVLLNGQNIVVSPVSGKQKFFRLAQ